MPVSFHNAAAPKVWTQTCGEPLPNRALVNAQASAEYWFAHRGEWHAHLAHAHPCALTAMHVFLASLRTNVLPLRIEGFSAGSHSGIALAIVAASRRTRFPSRNENSLQVQLGAIAALPGMVATLVGMM